MPSILDTQGLLEGYDIDDDDDEFTTSSNPLDYISRDVFEHLRSWDLSGCVRFSNGNAIQTQGVYGDVSTGSVEFNGKLIKVALKRLRFYLKEDLKRIFEKEIYVWSKLEHPNILRLLGFTFDPATGYPVLVSQWMKNGSASAYVQSNPDFDLMRLVTGIAEGLAYLHSQGVTHSNIKPENILVTRTGDALICNFGSARISNPSRSLGLMTNGRKGTTRYLARELLVHDANESTPYSKEADVWAFGMTVYELFTRQRPYQHLKEEDVSRAIRNRRLPIRPELLKTCPPDVQDLLWSICQRCWVHNPRDRIQMTSIVQELRDFQGQRISS